MSLPTPETQRSLFDVPVLTGALFDPDDRYRIFRESVMPQLWDVRDKLAELYCENNGRPATEPVLLLGVTLLQFMEKAPDRKAAECVRLHLGWKYALELEIGDPGFDHSRLSRFRDRLLEDGSERIGFDALLKGLREAGLVRKAGKQRLDSTHVLGAVAKMSRLEAVRETIRLALEEVRRQGAQCRLPCWPLLEARYIDSQIPWHRLDVDELKTKFEQAGADALELLEWFSRQPGELRDHPQAKLLQRVFDEQYELNAKTPRRRKSEASGVVKNPHDPDVQWACKDQNKKKQWEGYKVQIAETVAEDPTPKEKGEPTEQFVTEVTTTEAIASDLDGRERLEKKQREHGDGVADELYVDGAYVTDDTLAEAHAEGRELMGPARPSTNTSGKDLFDATAFDVNIAERKAICPAGHESRQCSRLENKKAGQVDYRFEWAGLCDDCPLQDQCTRSQSGRRMLVVGEHHDELQQRRREMQTEEFAKKMHQRNGIEATISEFTRAGGRQTRYRSLKKTSLAHYFQAAALNAGRLIRLQQWEWKQALQAPA